MLLAGTVVAIESCSGAHHLARRLRLMGLDARLIASHFIIPFRVQGASAKNDANDAAAICKAASRVGTRCVPVKTQQQQGWQGIHRLREGYREECTACINRIRGLLAEFGWVFPQSPDSFRRVLSEVLEDASNELPGMLCLGPQRAQAHWRVLESEIAWCDQQVKHHVRNDPAAAHAAQLHGVGELTASALVAAVGDMRQFNSARQFSAWVGLVPSQNSSGGKNRLGRMIKRDDDYLRTLLIQGAKSALLAASKRSDRISQWPLQLRDRGGWQRAVVALANKNACILWAVLTREIDFDPEHVPAVPPCKLPAPAPAPALAA